MRVIIIQPTTGSPRRWGGLCGWRVSTERRNRQVFGRELKAESCSEWLWALCGTSLVGGDTYWAGPAAWVTLGGSSPESACQRTAVSTPCAVNCCHEHTSLWSAWIQSLASQRSLAWMCCAHVLPCFWGSQGLGFITDLANLVPGHGTCGIRGEGSHRFDEDACLSRGSPEKQPTGRI